jgi:prophage regulatory protein
MAPRLIRPQAKSHPDNIVFYSANDLARRWNVHAMTIWKWLKRGQIPQPVKIGPGTTRWRSDDIERHERALQESAE